ncbi:hypothetical protein [Longispora albida]|uniref:hypothetical protein n=1 Tax=Longispora albida TaxID=203523 RepID=UPI0012F7F6BD|nr:hypothetical protein [Longispora albida]
MTAWTVTLRGIRYRWGRSLAVLLLATIAVTAAVLAPAYSRAASESILLDGLRTAPAASTGLSIAAASPASAASAPTANTKLEISNALMKHPVLRDAFGAAVSSVETEVLTGEGADALSARLAYRDSACEHLAVTGTCPKAESQVLVSDRTAKEHNLAAGQQIVVRPGGSARTAKTRTLTITGTYTAKDPAESYWGRTAYFSAGYAGPDGASTRIDAVFAGVEEDVRAAGGDLRLRVEQPLDPAKLTLANVGQARASLKQLAKDLPPGGLQVSSALTGVLDDIVVEQDAIGRSVPVIAIPLVLLSLFVLFLLVASVSEERSPELALAKLRGYPLASAGRFGLAETMLLIVLAAPLGLLTGVTGVRVAAGALLADGTQVELTGAVLLTAGAAVLGALLAAAGAGWRSLGRPVLALLRRVPDRAQWRATALEVAAAVLAAAALFQAFGDRSSPLALLAAPLLALVAGMLAARALAGYARGSLRRAARKGRLAGLLSAAQLARRPAGHRIAIVLTVAVALLTFAASAWDIAAVAREDRARGTMGANRVYTVDAAHPDALAAIVAQADPQHSMAVVRGRTHYAGGFVELLGVDSGKLAAVADWEGQDKAALAAKLHPEKIPQLLLTERVDVDVTAAGIREKDPKDKDRNAPVISPIRLVALVSSPGEPPRTITLGQLANGTKTYGAAVPGCASGCRLLALGVSRTPGTTDQITADLTITAIKGIDNPGFATEGRWRKLTARAPQAEMTVRAGQALTLTIRSSDPGDVLAEYVPAPDALPVVVAGATPAADASAKAFSLPALTEQPQPFTIAGKADGLPRAGARGLLFDLEYAARSAERTGSLADADQLRYEVWASEKAPEDLDKRLTAAGARVLEAESFDTTMARLDRLAPALALRLYMLAGAAAVLLAAGAVLLSAYVGATARLNELAALRLAGVPGKVLRRGVVREYRSLLGVPLLIGVLAGLGGAAVMLPGLQLVSVKDPAGLGRFSDLAVTGWLPVSVAAIIIGLAAAVLLVLRMLGKATPERLREGVR